MPRITAIGKYTMGHQIVRPRPVDYKKRERERVESASMCGQIFAVSHQHLRVKTLRFLITVLLHKRKEDKTTGHPLHNFFLSNTRKSSVFLAFLLSLQFAQGAGIMEVSFETKPSDQKRSENLARYLRKKQEREALQSTDLPSEPQPLLALPGPSFPYVNFDPTQADDSSTCSSLKEEECRDQKFYINGRYRFQSS